MQQQMTDDMRFAKRTGILFLMAGLFVFLLYLYFFVPFQDFTATIQQANPFYYSLALIALLLAVTFYSLTWHSLLKLLSVKTSFMKAFQFICIGTFVDLLVPAESVSGDISRIYLMSKESGENAGKVVASVVGHRIFSGLVVFVGFLIGSVYFILKYSPPSLVQGAIVIMLVVSIVSQSLLFYLSTRRHATEKLVNWLINLLVRLSRGRWHFDQLRKSAEKLLTAFHDGIATFGQRPKMLVLPMLFASVAWFFDLLLVALVFFSLGSFGTSISLSLIVIVYSIGVGLQTIPIGIPAEAGFFEIIMTSVYTFFGVPIEVSAVATVLTRVLTFGVKLLIGGVAVQWLGIKRLRGPVASN
jgi:uncharacterized protein (TIRG00374 family)